MESMVPYRNWRVVDGNSTLQTINVGYRGYAMKAIRWLSSWHGWSIVMALSLSIHVSGHVAYQAGVRSAVERQDPMSLAMQRVLTLLAAQQKEAMARYAD